MEGHFYGFVKVLHIISVGFAPFVLMFVIKSQASSFHLFLMSWGQFSVRDVILSTHQSVIVSSSAQIGSVQMNNFLFVLISLHVSEEKESLAWGLLLLVNGSLIAQPYL